MKINRLYFKIIIGSFRLRSILGWAELIMGREGGKPYCGGWWNVENCMYIVCTVYSKTEFLFSLESKNPLKKYKFFVCVSVCAFSSTTSLYFPSYGGFSGRDGDFDFLLSLSLFISWNETNIAWGGFQSFWTRERDGRQRKRRRIETRWIGLDK